jgi:orotidine-5'-phosphate decarboxylase
MRQLLAALDVDTTAQALALADQLRGTSEGPAVVQAIAGRGDRVFLDLKFHDIPQTVAGAIAAAARLGVWMVNVHAAGGSAMMRAAIDAAQKESARSGRPAPLVIAVTMLTSLSQPMLDEIGVGGSLPAQVQRLAALAKSAGLDGVVASPQEIGLVRAACGRDFVVVTPGIRSADDPKDDQNRTLSALEAMAAGADYLVVGRPIIGASDPRAAAERIAASCRAAAL